MKQRKFQYVKKYKKQIFQYQKVEQFKPGEEFKYIGLRVHNLPKSCTKELFYVKIFLNLDINTNSVKAFKVSGNDSINQCEGDAFVYFDSEQSARDAMYKIIGLVMHEKELNCSFLIPKEDLKLENDKNVYVHNLSTDVTLADFYGAMIVKGQVLSVLLARDEIKNNMSGYASFKTEFEAQGLNNTQIAINGHQYIVKFKQHNSNAVQQFNFGGLSKNIKLEFDSPLTIQEPIEYENAIKAQILQKFSIDPVSVFVWGKNGRHYNNHSQIRLHGLISGNKISNVDGCEECTINSITDDINDIGSFSCYKDPLSKCKILLNARCKAFASFALESEATSFIYQFYSRSGDMSNFLFKEQSVILKKCIPNTKNPTHQKQIIKQIALFPKPDKSFIYLGNIRKDINENKIKEDIEKNIDTEVLSIQLKNSSSNGRNDSLDKKFQYATIQLKNSSESEKFIQDFKQNDLFRKKFDDIFENNFKYANFLTPTYIRESEKKEKKKLKKIQKINQQISYQSMMQQMVEMKMKKYYFHGQRQNQYPNISFLPPNSFIYPQVYVNNVNNWMNYQGGHFQKPMRSFSSSRAYQQESTLFKNYQEFSVYNQYNNNDKFIKKINQEIKRNNSEGRPNFLSHNTDNLQPQNLNPQKNAIHQSSFSPVKMQLIQSSSFHIVPINPPMAPTQSRPEVLILPNLKDIIKKPDKEKKAILGQYLYPKVMAIITDEYKVYVPKIIGMITDFELFSLQEIYEIIMNKNLLEDQIKDAIEIIEESTQTQSLPGVLILPKLEDLIGKSEEENKAIFKQHLYSKVMAIITDEQKVFVPKIIDMITDFELFSLHKIYDIITNNSELEKQINDAIKLIEESSQTQSLPGVLILPKLEDLIGKSEEENKAIFKQHLYSKVMAIITDELKVFVPKIIDMITDFELFSLHKIYDIITNNSELEKQINDAIKLIEESFKTQSLPGVLILPKLEDIIKQPNEKKREILKPYLYPKVKAFLTDEQKDYLPKIIDMLMDFDVFYLQEIYELFSNNQELEEEIKDAIELIEESKCNARSSNNFRNF